MRLRTMLLAALFITAPACAAPAEAEGTAESATTARSPALDDMASALDRLRAARDAEAATETTLHRELLQIGPALDATQKAAFVKAFWAEQDHATAMTEYFSATKALSDAIAAFLSNRTPDAVKNAIARSMKAESGLEDAGMKADRQLFFDAAAELAETPMPYQALRVGGLVLASRSFEANDPIRVFSELRRGEVSSFDHDVVGKLVVRALLGSAIQLGVERGDRAGIVGGLREAVETVKRGYGAYESVTTCGDLSPFLGALDAIVKGESGGALEGVSPKALIGGKTFEGMDRVASGVGTFLAIWDTGAAAERGDLQGFLSSGATAVQGVADMTIAIRRVTLGATRAETPFLGAASKVAGKFAAGIGVVTSAVTLLDDLDHDNAAFSAKLDVIGDAASLGAAICALAGATVAGPVLIAVAAGAHYLAKVIERMKLEREMQADISEALDHVDFPLSTTHVDIRSILKTADPYRIDGLASDVGLDAGQIQKLVVASPALVSRVVAPRDVSYDWEGIMKQEFGMSGTQMYALFDAMRSAGGGTYQAAALRVFQLALSFSSLDFGGLDPGGKRCDRWRTWLGNERGRAGEYFAASADRLAWQRGIDAVVAKLPATCAPEPD